MTHQFDPLTKGSGVEGFFAASYLTAAEKFFSEKLKGSSLSTETLSCRTGAEGGTRTRTAIATTPSR